MTKEELSLAISYIDDALISEAYEKKTKGRSFYVKFAALAASLFHYKELTVGQVKDYLEKCNIPVRK